LALFNQPFDNLNGRLRFPQKVLSGIIPVMLGLTEGGGVNNKPLVKMLMVDSLLSIVPI